MRFTILICLMLFFNNLNAQEPFEGIITFKVVTRLKDENNPNKDYYLKKYGDSMQITIAKNGSFRRKYYGNKDVGFDWHIYDRPSNTYYAKWKNIDTIYHYNCSDLFSELKSIVDGVNEPILGRQCKSIVVTTFDPIGKETLAITYHYSGEQLVNPSTYSQYKEGYIDKVYEKSKSHILKYEMDLLNVFVTIEAVRIEPKTISNSIFQIPESLPKKKW